MAKSVYNGGFTRKCAVNSDTLMSLSRLHYDVCTLVSEHSAT